ncbi:general transcription factor II-I repeat domain-containing protein 2B-like [Hydra vulgaris]|uniref:General transcription factor II-I repeat domain-containing protein 2B-like n=1 Tax=Hydra vulgaris TaxID=6087 RepID=A0ABM4DM95_HYDVU
MASSKSKQRKIDKECRLFNDEWQTKYFFVECNSVLVCLVCNESASVCKEYNLRRHYDTKHSKTYNQFVNEVRKVKSIKLKNTLFKQQDLLKRGNTETENAAIASYKVSLHLAKNCKPFSDGEIIKESLEIMFKNICPEKLKILNISLSRQTITRRTCDIANDLSLSLTEKIKAFQYYSIAIDESTDISQTAQLAVFICGIDNGFLVTEELLDIHLMQGRTTGENIFLAMKKVFKKFNLTYNRLISITSDGGSSMIGKKMGVVSRLENEMAENNLSLIKLHCIIHQQNLTAKTMDVEKVMSVVVKAINSIKSSSLRCRQFEAFLAENDSEYGGLLYYTEVRWLSRGNMLKRTYDLRQNMLDLFKIINKDYPPELEEKEFIEKFAFLVDLTQHYNIQRTPRKRSSDWKNVQHFSYSIFI